MPKQASIALKGLAIVGAIICCAGGVYSFAVATDFVASALHDPAGFMRSEYLEGAFISLPFSIVSWAALAGLARLFRQSLSPRAVLVATVPLVLVFGLFGASVLACFVYGAFCG